VIEPLEESVAMKKHYREPEGKTFPQMEEETLSLWQDQGILQMIKDRMSGGNPLVFCEGPPTANDHPHIGHALTRVVKDAFLRYHVMNGRKVVPFIAGWDCHGLPVELEIEKALGLHTKKDIEALGIGRFNKMCRESVVRYKSEWEQMSRRIGYWIDYDNAYLTMSNEYIESVWWSLKQLHSKGLLVKENKVVPYCPRCGTTLSTHEVALGFRDAEDRYVVAKFRVHEFDACLLVWTASPWVLADNALVAVDKDRDYVMFEHAGEKYILAEDRLPLMSPGHQPISSLRGSDLVGKKYDPLLGRRDFGPNGYTVVHSPDVSRDEGTGVMGISPAHGSVDFDIGQEHGISILDSVDASGRFTEDVPELVGRLAKDSEPEILRLLESRGSLFKWGLIKHSYPHCWRCGTALIYKALDSWFVKTGEHKNRIIELNEEIQWVPEAFKHGRFGNFLADAKDWAISRSRYWGTPLPVWRCDNGHEVCVGSYEELNRLAVRGSASSIEPHRPDIDHVMLKCPECASDMHREEAVIDCWYDSGCAPFAQYHYPFDNIEEFDTHRSVDFIAEREDQTRGWFYTQLALGALLFDKPAFLSVLVHGHVLNEDGKRMTESAEHVVYTGEVFSSVGADASRLYFLTNPVWVPVQFSKEMVRETMVGTLNTLLNVYAFFASNANAYGFKEQHDYTRTHDLDRWIISRLHSTTQEARSGFDSLEVHRSVRAVRSFVDDLSGWYVRRSRRRFWEENDPQDRYSAHCTLNECLLTLSKLMAPITPFFSDWLYRSLLGPKSSVHLEEYPVPDQQVINGTLERQMELVMTAVEAGRLARQQVDMKLRQPLPEVVIAADPDRAWMLRRFEKMIAEELNVKKVQVLESRDKMVQFAVSPNLKTLGPKLKENAAEVSKLLSKVDENELVKHLRTKGRIRLGGFDLEEEDIIVSEKNKPGFSHSSLGDIHVYVALEITPNLKLEGLSREVIRRVQRMRKDQRLEFEDPVDIEYTAHADIETAITAHKTHIMHETHATSLTKRDAMTGGTKWIVNKLPLELSLKRSAL